MSDPYENIEFGLIKRIELSNAVTKLWATFDFEELSSTIRLLLQEDNFIGCCAVFDLYSYCNTTEGTWKSGDFAEWKQQMIELARKISDEIWADEHEFEQPELRDRMVASVMHAIFRNADATQTIPGLEDGHRVLHSLRTERHWRVIFPTVFSVFSMRGKDPEFDREVVPLLAEVAKKEELSSFIKMMAIDAIGTFASTDDLKELEAMMKTLPLPESAVCAWRLLEASDEYKPAVEAVAKHWTPDTKYPIGDVLNRIGRPVSGPLRK